jgi:hypothetical protein
MEPVMSNRQLTDEDKAFIESFKETHNQYDVTDEDIVGFLLGEDKYFDGYTQVADAYNLWDDAIAFIERKEHKHD